LADNGAFNLVTLFVDPIFISSVILSADPSIVETEGTSKIAADVITNLNTPPPDGTTVNFTTTCGSVLPFGQTTDGRAEADFTAPATEGTCFVTGSVGGVSGSVSVRVTTELTINPSTIGVDGSTGAVVPFTISGGIGSYTTTSSDPINAFNDNGAGGGTAGDGIKNGTEGGIWTGSSINVTVPVGASGSVTLNVQDSDGNTVSATITITAAGALAISPASVDITDACSFQTLIFQITGGIPGYTVSSSSIAFNDDGAGGGTAGNGTMDGGEGGSWTVASDGDSFTVTLPADAIPGFSALPDVTPVILTVQDNNGNITTGTINITNNTTACP
jgi:hypothetical protein